MRACPAALIALTLLPARAVAGGLVPTTAPPIDPDAAASLIIRNEAPAQGARFAWGGRFCGDLDGDGMDDIVLQSPAADELEVWFGDPAWAGPDQTTDNENGDTTLELPAGCRQADRIRYAGLGDLDDDGFDDLGAACLGSSGDVDGQPFQGAFVLWFGRPRPWGGTVAEPDVAVPGTPIVFDGGGLPISGDAPGAGIGPAGDLDGDGFDDFVVTGWRVATVEIPLAWVFRGSALLPQDLEGLADATWTLEGGDRLRCLLGLEAGGLGDVDGDGLDDLAVGCPLQPPPNPGQPELENEMDISWSVWLGTDVAAAGPGELTFAERSFSWASGTERVPLVGPFAALGDLDGDGFGEVGIVSWFETGGSLAARVVDGHAAPWADIGMLDPWVPFAPGEGYLHREGLQVAASGPVPGSPAGVWLRLGHEGDARVGLLVDVDPSTWLDVQVPPLLAVFSTPGGAAPGPDWRLGIGGPGDADGDGVLDLLIAAGFEDADGCVAEDCGGAWLLLCGDRDGDGVSVCAGDCDDADATVAPGLVEQCDAVDHDCDGSDGLDDADGDGVLPCEGDCDDADPARLPGAEEGCDSPADMDCDGLAPQDDRDLDGTVNCEDCQPWDPGAHPAAPEVCDGLDDDCDGELPPDEQDVDRDGWPACSVLGAEVDCDDRNPWVHPFRFEDCGNGIDDDCNGDIDEDADADGDGVRTCEGDCRDGDAQVFPGAEETCDGIDDNCNGHVDDARDWDADGFSPCRGDCDDEDPWVYPGAVGGCSAEIDGNCDGLPDLLDADGDGSTACSGDCDDRSPGVGPAAVEFCDRLDNDCDSAVDEPFDVDGDSWATCLGDCADGDSARHPQVAEPDCADGLDGDCDGVPDQAEAECPPVRPPEDLGPRPYGLACSDCRGDLGGARGPGFLPAALLGLALRRGRRRAGAGRQAERRHARRMAPVIGALACAAAMTLAVPGARAARKEQALLVYLAAQPDLSAMVATRELAAPAGLDPHEVLHTSELLDAQGDVLLVAGAASTSHCEQDGAAPALADAIDLALDALIQLDNAGAALVLDKAIGGLPCLDSALPKRLLQNLFYYRGVAREGAGDRARAEEDFRRALAIQPDYPGDPNFPPEIGELLEAVRATTSGTEPLQLLAYAPGSTDVRVDGQDWDAMDGALAVLPGSHVVQFRRGRQTWTTAFDLVPGNRPVVLHASERVRALKDCVLDPAAREFAAATVGLAAADAGMDLAALVDLGGESDEVRWIYRAGIDRFSFEDGYWEYAPGKTASRGGAKGGSGRAGGGGGTRTAGTGGSGRSGGAVASADGGTAGSGSGESAGAAEEPSAADAGAAGDGAAAAGAEPAGGEAGTSGRPTSGSGSAAGEVRDPWSDGGTEQAADGGATGAATAGDGKEPGGTRTEGRGAGRGERGGDASAAGAGSRSSAGTTRRQKAPGPRPEDRARVRIAAGYGYVHPFHYLEVPLDFGVRLVSGLFADVGIELGVAGPSGHGTVLLPTASVGPSWRFDLGDFEPRLGAVFRVGLDSAASLVERIAAKPGWAVRAGFDVAKEGSPLLLGLDVQAGMLGRPFWLSASFGVGARF